MNDEATKIAGRAAEIIGKYFGPEISKAYLDFYKGKDNATILVSLEELLTEALGKSRAEIEVRSLKE